MTASPPPTDRALVDLLLDGGAVVTMDRARRVLEPGWVAVTDRTITAVGDGPPPAAHRRIDTAGHIVIPGLISVHQHAMDFLLRAARRRPTDFLDWLLGVYYRGVTAMTATDASLAATMAVLEAQRAGITTLCDNWGVGGGTDSGRDRACLDATIAAYRRAGGRVLVARMLGDTLPPGWAAAARAHGVDPAALVTPTGPAIDAVAALLADHPAGGLVTVGPAPELPEMASPRLRTAVTALARAAGVPVCTHLAASPASAAAAPLAELDDEGFLGGHLLGAHASAVGPADLARLAARDVRIAHCPGATGALAGAVTPVVAMRAAGITVGLGTDNPSLNPRVDLLEEGRWAARLARLRDGDPTVLPESEILALATVDGARCLGLDGLVGALVPGLRADLTVLDARGPHWWPRADPTSAVVRSARPGDVRHVLVDGRAVLTDGSPTWLSPTGLATVGTDTQRAADDLLARTGLDRPAEGSHR